MDEIRRKVGAVLVCAALYWGAGFLIQRWGNGARDVEATGWWVWLLGLRPGRGERIHLRAALWQALALLYLVVGFAVAWFCDVTVLQIVTLVFLVGSPLVALVMEDLIIRFGKR